MTGGISSYKKIIFIAVLVGILSGLGALVFFEGLKYASRIALEFFGYNAPVEGQSAAEIAQWMPPEAIWLIIPVICLGGLVSGLIASRYAPEIEGAGKDAAINAFHHEGVIRARVPFLKAFATIVVIATGGSAGREGPVAYISAGLGSLAADLLHLSPHDRRIAIVTGIGAGVGTIFKAPLGGALIAAEVLYTRDFESEAIIPAFIASVLGYSIFCSVEGFEPIFNSPDISWTLYQIPLFFLLGCICAAVGLLYIRFFHRTRISFNHLFEKHNIPLFLKPAAGALLTGLLIVVLAHLSPKAFILGLSGMGTGYGFFQLILYSMLPLSVLILLPFMKIIATSFTIGSGGSGGVFGPGLVIGGATGGAVGTFMHMVLPGLVPMHSVPAFAVVGMIALFGPVANAPLAVMIMVVEMTGDFSLLVPAMAAVSIANLLTGEETIFIEQVVNKSQSDAHRGEYAIEILEMISTASAMVPAAEVTVLSPDDTCERVLGLINTTGHTGFPVMDADELVGIITIGDLRRIQTQKDGISASVGDEMTSDVITIIPGASLEEALEIMMTRDVNHLPVVDPSLPQRMLGFLTRSDIMHAYAHAVAKRRKRE
jgi:CIC family chloride channel protein